MASISESPEHSSSKRDESDDNKSFLTSSESEDEFPEQLKLPNNKESK
jgi:hypothetical protein